MHLFSAVGRSLAGAIQRLAGTAGGGVDHPDAEDEPAEQAGGFPARRPEALVVPQLVGNTPGMRNEMRVSCAC